MINLSGIGIDNKKLILIILVFLAIVYVDYVFVIKLQLRLINTVGPKITQLKQDTDNLSRDLARMQELKGKQAQMSKKLARAKKVISELEISALLNDISEIANKNNVKIGQMTPTKEVQGPQQAKAAQPLKFISFLIKLDLTSDYHRLGHFINDLENAPVFIAVQNLRITPQQPQQPQQNQQVDLGKQNVELTLLTYVKK